MTKMVINKSNWSGEECEVINEGVEGIFTIGMYYDEKTLYQFKLENLVVTPGEEIFKITCLQEESWEWHVYHINGKYICQDCGVEREHVNPFCAFAQLAWNII